MINHYLERDQEQRRLEALNAVEIEAGKNTDNRRLSYQDDSSNYAAGEFDGKIGDIPDKNLFRFVAYRAGYQEGLTEYYLNKYQIEIETEF